jgi:hypothetical protein
VKCGFFTGRDLRKIGADLYLSHLFAHEKMTPELAAKAFQVISDKKGLFEELKKMGYFIPGLLEKLDKYKQVLSSGNFYPQFTKEVRESEIQMGITLLQIFFSQGVEKIQRVVKGRLSDQRRGILELLSLEGGSKRGIGDSGREAKNSRKE